MIPKWKTLTAKSYWLLGSLAALARQKVQSANVYMWEWACVCGCLFIRELCVSVCITCIFLGPGVCVCVFLHCVRGKHSMYVCGLALDWEL